MVSPKTVLPISLDEARLILSEVIQGGLIKEDTVAVLCDGSSPTNSVFLSACGIEISNTHSDSAEGDCSFL
jgi:hypothetical protein